MPTMMSTGQLIERANEALRNVRSTRLDLGNYQAWITEHCRDLSERVGERLARGHMSDASRLSCDIADLCSMHSRLGIAIRRMEATTIDAPPCVVHEPARAR